MLLKAGCGFSVLHRPEGSKETGCFTDKNTIWVEFSGIRGFQAFESGDEYLEDDTRYLPTPSKLARANGGDWY
jgi:hypothetical protein